MGGSEARRGSYCMFELPPLNQLLLVPPTLAAPDAGSVPGIQQQGQDCSLRTCPAQPALPFWLRRAPGSPVTE
eukprot:1262084-Rhodomonas_salina.1